MILVLGLLEALVTHDASGILAAVLARVGRITGSEKIATQHRRRIVGHQFLQIKNICYILP